MNLNDIDQAFGQSLVLYKGDIAYCTRALNDTKIELYDINTKISRHERFSLAFIQPPPGRIGYVNTPVGCAYVSRTHRRQWKIGLCKANTKVDFHQFRKNDPDVPYMRAEIEKMYSPHLIPAIKGEYPSLKEAIKIVKDKGISCAFDRMFCITASGRVEFRSKDIVGGIAGDNIKFNEKFSYLQVHLKGNYCESILDVRA